MAKSGYMPEGIRIDDWDPLDLSDCHELKQLPTDFHVEAGVELGGIFIDFHEVVLDQAIPHTLVTAIVGKRLGDIVDHRLIRDHAFADATIMRAAIKPKLGLTCLLVDRMFGVHFEDDDEAERELASSIYDFEEAWEYVVHDD